MNTPNKLTVTRIVLVPVLIIVYLFPYHDFGIHVPAITLLGSELSVVSVLSLIIFTVASITDYLDGKIARANNLITTFGKFLDPIADKLLVNSIILLLAYSGKISVLVPVIMIARDTIVDAIRSMAASSGIVIAASKLGKLKTVTQMIAIILLLLDNFPFNGIGLPLATIMIWVATGVSIISGLDYLLKSKSMITETM